MHLCSRGIILLLFILEVGAVISGCATSSSNFVPAAGPSVAEIIKQPEVAPPIPVVEIDDTVARRILAAQKRTVFSEMLPDNAPPKYIVGLGDVLEVSIWEAPPAMLFGGPILDPRAGMAASRAVSFPEQMVGVNGTINIPFAGMVPVTGKSLGQIEDEIVKRLTGKANQPQVLVRITHNVSSNVTVVGEVAQSVRIPLTAKGERLLDALVASGGVRQPVGKMTIQLSRNGRILAMPLETIIQDPKQNVILQPGDVIIALYQPLSFTALGATGKNEEVYFEAQGISLAQALGRIGGIQDTRADARGIFVFRFEDPLVVESNGKPVQLTPEGKAPVVYRVDLKDPHSFLVAQNFPMRNKDVVYVSNASGAELQKFLNILTSSLFSVNSLITLTR
ncbi:Capsule polysaccharide export outer membrane protein CtrA [Gammaproteobacteria bacterium]